MSFIPCGVNAFGSMKEQISGSIARCEFVFKVGCSRNYFSSTCKNYFVGRLVNLYCCLLPERSMEGEAERIGNNGKKFSLSKFLCKSIHFEQILRALLKVQRFSEELDILGTMLV